MKLLKKLFRITTWKVQGYQEGRPYRLCENTTKKQIMNPVTGNWEYLRDPLEIWSKRNG